MNLVFISSKNDDDETNQINNDINECVICLEPVLNYSEKSKFGCIHSKYMHDDCVKNLSKCPLCRVKSDTVEMNNNNISYLLWKEKLFCFLLCCFFSILLFMLMYPLMFLNFFGNYTSMSNSTYNNYTIDNYTSMSNSIYNNYTLVNLNYKII